MGVTSLSLQCVEFLIAPPPRLFRCDSLSQITFTTRYGHS